MSLFHDIAQMQVSAHMWQFAECVVVTKAGSAESIGEVSGIIKVTASEGNSDRGQQMILRAEVLVPWAEAFATAEVPKIRTVNGLVFRGQSFSIEAIDRNEAAGFVVIHAFAKRKESTSHSTLSGNR
ncbi:MAG: hypothetical protein U0996_25005 [Planctomycetaceae bacterium]